ncbi:met16 [Symbiodinium natans]|uniref:Met16 protein n=1 Tax=Symbiodinium natans TaxID=878477 RepID=A0A812QSW0_9DINO|nr:met16 [Symbiodinium natans]
MSSSAAGALGSMLAKSSPARPPEAGGAQDSGAPSAPAASEPTPKKSGAKSVLNQSSAMTSSAAGALGGLLSQGSAPPTRTDPSATGDAAPEAPPAKKASAAKSVLNQSTAMTSSAAGALGGLLSQGAAKAPPTRTEPPAGSSDAPATSAKASSEAPPAKKASGAKSVLNQSSTMTSSAAGALGGLLAQGGPKSSASMPAGSAGTASAAPAASAPPRSADDRKSALATSTVMTSSAAANLGPAGSPGLQGIQGVHTYQRASKESAACLVVELRQELYHWQEAPSAPASTQAGAVLAATVEVIAVLPLCVFDCTAKAVALFGTRHCWASMKLRSPGSADEALASSSLTGCVSGFVRNHSRKCIFLLLFGFVFVAAAGPPLGNLRQSFSEERVASINAQLMQMTPQEILRWAHRALPGRVVQMSSLGASGMVILDMMDSIGLLKEIPVITVDTLHLFPETYQHIANVTKHYPHLKLHVYYPLGFGNLGREKFDAKYGASLWKEDFDRYSLLSKLEPAAQALSDFSPRAWITGRRRSQGGDRETMALAEYDGGMIKLNPLAYWTNAQVWEYIREHGVPYNVLHDRGFSSIGDEMNTRPVKDGEEERAGRFDQSVKVTECGMHTHLAKKARASIKRAQSSGTPHLPCPSCVDVDKTNFQEFYSPMCGHCTHFAPTYAEIANRLAKDLSIEGPKLVGRVLRVAFYCMYLYGNIWQSSWPLLHTSVFTLQLRMTA